jgi:hypothetical protein
LTTGADTEKLTPPKHQGNVIPACQNWLSMTTSSIPHDEVAEFRRSGHITSAQSGGIRMRLQNLTAVADDDSLPVIVPRNGKALVPIPHERVRRLRKHLIAVLRALRTTTGSGHSASPVRREPEGFAARVARTACAMCEGWCCRNGEDDGFLDEQTVARLRRAQVTLDARAVLRLYVERVPEAGYQGSCIFHGKQGCTLDRSLRSDVCNSYFCGGLHNYMANGDGATPVTVIAGEGDKMRTSPILLPWEAEVNAIIRPLV